MEKSDSCIEKDRVKQQKTPQERIKDAFDRLNHEYVIDPSVLIEILFTSGELSMASFSGAKSTQPEAQRYLHMRGYGCINHYLDNAEKELLNVQIASKKLQKVFNEMKPTTINALATFSFEIKKYEQFLKTTIEETEKVKVVIGQWKKKYFKRGYQKTGRPKKETTFRITEILADQYHRATGKFPTVSVNSNEESYGAFLDLVTSVYGVLGIADSPNAMARKAVESWKRRHEMVVRKK